MEVAFSIISFACLISDALNNIILLLLLLILLHMKRNGEAVFNSIVHFCLLQCVIAKCLFCQQIKLKHLQAHTIKKNFGKLFVFFILYKCYSLHMTLHVMSYIMFIFLNVIIFKYTEIILQRILNCNSFMSCILKINCLFANAKNNTRTIY